MLPLLAAVVISPALAGAQDPPPTREPAPYPAPSSVPGGADYLQPQPAGQSWQPDGGRYPSIHPQAQAPSYPQALENHPQTLENHSQTLETGDARRGRPAGIPIQLVQRDPAGASAAAAVTQETRRELVAPASHPVGMESAGPESGTADRATAEPQASEATANDSAAPPIPLTPISGGGPSETAPRRSTTIGTMFTVGGSLAVVLGVFFLVLWLTRRAFPKAGQGLPPEIFELLGQAALGTRQTMQLVRVGNRLLVIAVSPAGVRTLSEITEADEVHQLAAACRRAHPESVSAAFRQVLGQFNQDAQRTRSGRTTYAVSTATVQRGRSTVEA